MENFIAHVSWLHERTPGMLAQRMHGVLLTDSGLSCDTFNIVCDARGDVDVNAVIEHFGERPFSWWSLPGDVAPAGLVRDESEVAMSLELAKLSPVDGFDVRRVRTREELRAFAQITAANWTPSDENVIRFYDLAAEAALRDDCLLRFYVGFVDGAPVATSEVTLTGNVAGLYGVSTLREFRGHGFGTAMTVLPLIDARNDGAERAILQASADGLRIYRRIGFEPYGEVTEFKPSPAPSSS